MARRQRNGTSSHDTKATNSPGCRNCFALRAPRSGGLTSRQGLSRFTRSFRVFVLTMSEHIEVASVHTLAAVFHASLPLHDLGVELVPEPLYVIAGEGPDVESAEDREHVTAHPGPIVPDRVDPAFAVVEPALRIILDGLGWCPARGTGPPLRSAPMRAAHA